MPQSDAPEVSHVINSARDRNLGLQNAAAFIFIATMSEGTDDKYDMSWSRWRRFIESIELEDDVFLDTIPSRLRPEIFSIFEQAVQKGEFTRGNQSNLASTTVQEALDQVAKIFESSTLPDGRCREYPFKRSGRRDFELDL